MPPSSTASARGGPVLPDEVDRVDAVAGPGRRFAPAACASRRSRRVSHRVEYDVNPQRSPRPGRGQAHRGPVAEDLLDLGLRRAEAAVRPTSWPFLQGLTARGARRPGVTASVHAIALPRQYSATGAHPLRSAPFCGLQSCWRRRRYDEDGLHRPGGGGLTPLRGRARPRIAELRLHVATQPPRVCRPRRALPNFL